MQLVRLHCYFLVSFFWLDLMHLLQFSDQLLQLLLLKLQIFNVLQQCWQFVELRTWHCWLLLLRLAAQGCWLHRWYFQRLLVFHKLLNTLHHSLQLSFWGFKVVLLFIYIRGLFAYCFLELPHGVHELCDKIAKVRTNSLVLTFVFVLLLFKNLLPKLCILYF